MIVEIALLMLASAVLFAVLAHYSERIVWLGHILFPKKNEETLYIGYDGEARTLRRHMAHEMKTFGGRPPPVPFSAAVTRPPGRIETNYSDDDDEGADFNANDQRSGFVEG